MLRSLEKKACPTLLYFSFVFPEDLKKSIFYWIEDFSLYVLYVQYVHTLYCFRHHTKEKYS